jgi:hypothetical protein
MSTISAGTTSNTALKQTGDTTGALVFQTNGTTTALTLSTAQLATLAGGLNFSTLDAGITFNKTSALTNSTLNDYEVGTWTPVIEGISSAGTATYATRNAYYLKIGRTVILSCFINWTGGTGTGNMKLTGLPFADSYGIGGAMIAYQESLTVPAGSFAVLTPNSSNTTQWYFWSTPTGGGSSAGLAYDSAAGINFNATYITST